MTWWQPRPWQRREPISSCLIGRDTGKSVAAATFHTDHQPAHTDRLPFKPGCIAHQFLDHFHRLGNLVFTFLRHTRQILADLINHPNAGGVLVLGLGCENSNIDVLKGYIGSYDQERVRFVVSQECEDEEML